MNDERAFLQPAYSIQQIAIDDSGRCGGFRGGLRHWPDYTSCCSPRIEMVQEALRGTRGFRQKQGNRQTNETQTVRTSGARYLLKMPTRRTDCSSTGARHSGIELRVDR